MVLRTILAESREIAPDRYYTNEGTEKTWTSENQLEITWIVIGTYIYIYIYSYRC